MFNETDCSRENLKKDEIMFVFGHTPRLISILCTLIIYTQGYILRIWIVFKIRTSIKNILQYCYRNPCYFAIKQFQF